MICDLFSSVNNDFFFYAELIQNISIAYVNQLKTKWFLQPVWAEANISSSRWEFSVNTSSKRRKIWMMKSGLISYCIRLVGKMTQVLKPQHSSEKQIQSNPKLFQPKVSSCRLLRFKWPALFLPCTFMFSVLSIRWKQKNLIKTELSVVCTPARLAQV